MKDIEEFLEKLRTDPGIQKLISDQRIAAVTLARQPQQSQEEWIEQQDRLRRNSQRQQPASPPEETEK
ncbi:hypothetical protein [Pelagicoccus sp. SDUM812002]|uniref:hypothetical protein n=1 Tax=Pelagicoccus sp. SDUM812002 TaxID=3041266 RepID=UPI0028116D79|nr:hypothetical protein [Pelagicoccus sp. SDUM812002]